MFQIHAPPYSQAFTPLAPRNPNACPFPSPSMSMSSSTAKPTTTTTSKLPPRLQRRSPPKPPLFGRQTSNKEKEQQQTRKREAYLGKVRQKRDDKTWEGRSEMILRAEFLERQRAWEEERKREAAEALLPDLVEEEDDEGDVDVEGYEEVEMVDRILSQEEEEFEALVEGWGGVGTNGREREREGYGSEDDEEWDRLFREVVGMDKGEVGEGEGGGKSGDVEGDGGMDLS